MVIKSAVLVVRDQDDGVAPVGSIAHRIDQLRYECLAALNVSGRMLVGFELGSQKPKVRVHKGNLRQRTESRDACSLRQKNLYRQEVRIGVDKERAETESLGNVGEVIRPGDSVLIEQIEDRAGDRLVAGVW